MEGDVPYFRDSNNDAAEGEQLATESSGFPSATESAAFSEPTADEFVDGDPNSGQDVEQDQGETQSPGTTRELPVVSILTDFSGARLLNASEAPFSRFDYGVNESVTLKNVKWLGRLTPDDEFQAFARAEFVGDEDVAETEKGFGKVSRDTAELDLAVLSGDSSLKQWLGKQSRIQIDWITEVAAGNTTSGVFYVVDADTPAVPSSDVVAIESQEDLAAGTETIGSLADATSTDAVGPTSATDSDTSRGGGGGGGGLSTGATAGIAVGAAIGGLLIIGALAWFFLRRRRQNKSLTDYSEQPSNAYMVDKEIPRRNTDSPTSPYSDENGVQRVPLEAISATRGVPTRNPERSSRGFAQYDDVPGRTSTGSRVNNTGTHTPQGVSTNVAHLVEDGMTAEEIRRLEEEERQLDDEIERARGR